MKRICFLCFAILLILCGCGKDVAQRQLYIMDTVVDISVYGEMCEETVNEIERMLNEVDLMASPTNPNSEVNRLNSAGSEGTTASEELCGILTQGQQIHTQTDGAFDITLGSLIDLWNVGGSNNIPSDEQIAGASAHCGAHKLSVGEGYARVENGTVINLGGIAKGYAANRAMEIFDKNQVDSAILSIGGNICVKGTKNDGTPWKIGVRDPDGSSAEYIGVVQAEDTVIAVSGDYERYFDENGVRYHHIIDAATGKPANSDIRSVSIVCQDGVRADALSTALFVMGREKALEFWRACDGFECIIIDKDMRVTVTPGISEKFRLTDGRYTLEVASR